MIHAILAIQQRLLRESLGARLARYSDVRIEGYAKGELGIALALRKLLDEGDISVDDPVIVITSIDDTLDTPVSCSRLLCEFPEVTIFGVCTDSMRGCSLQLRIDVQEFECSLNGLAEAIR